MRVDVQVPPGRSTRQLQLSRTILASSKTLIDLLLWLDARISGIQWLKLKRVVGDWKY